MKKFWPEITLGLVLLTVFLTNYTPGTWLIGWDNVMPEFNIWLNLKRSLFAVWQEYQGLGLVGGMGHATDLIRQLILAPFILILPHSLIRYLWHFFLLGFGTFTIYFGLKKQLKFSSSISLLSSLFYLLNFGSIQYFWAPLESFSAFWGFFPLLIFTLWHYLQKPSRRSLFYLLLANLFTIPAFYVQTIFIVYILCLFLILFSHFIFHLRLSSVKFYFSFFFKFVLINSFWLLPFLYFFATNLRNPSSGIGNLMASGETFARNLNRGHLLDFLLLRGYYFDFPDTEGKFMGPWVSYFSNHYVLICGYLLGLTALFGLIYLFIKFKKFNYLQVSVLLIFLLSCIALLSDTTPFLQINSLLRQNQLLGQVFRAPFTKFIVPAIFSFTFLFAYGLQALTSLAIRLKYSSKIFSYFLVSSFLFLIFIFSFPVFKGNYISPKMRQNIPQEYFDLFSYLQSKSPTARIVNLPSGNFWGWTNYNFGIRGSGFIWYAVPQPILDRAFDVWNLKNEQYYWELDYALKRRDPQLLSQIFQKYSIEYVLFDNNVYFPDEKIYAKQSLATQSLLPQVPGLNKVKDLNHIALYHYSKSTSPHILQSPISINPTDFYLIDQAYLDHSDYINSSQPTNQYPYQNLFTNRFSLKNPPPIDSLPILPKSHSPTSSLLQNQNSNSLYAYNFPQASLSQSYLVKVDYQYFSGLPLTIAINSDNLQSKYLYTKMNTKSGPQTAWFIIPAVEKADFNQGITVLFNNSSPSSHPSQNQVFDVNLYPIPLDQLLQTQIPASTQKSTSTPLSSTSNIFFYKISLPSRIQNLESSFLVLPQSYSPGWLAFYFAGLKPVFLSGHTQANNWANAWFISPKLSSEGGPRTVYLLFWPQLLEFIGLALLPLPFLLVLRRRHK